MTRPPTALRFLAPGERVGAVAALCLLFVSSSATLVQAMETGPVVSVSGGQVRGRTLGDGGGAVFKGVPFAQPPVGDLRWREPLPVLSWNGIREAGKSGPPAAQAALGWNDASAAASSEDCLYLDVWTPSMHPQKALPVMVWIHGGGNVAGAGGFDPLYDGKSLISHGVVLVVIEYRLGFLGFLSHPELTRESPHHASGNYAILDQIAALQWVHDNIARFGGDAGSVTAFGQSAGAVDVLALLASPLCRGLVHRAICESGPLPPASASTTLAEAGAAGVAAAAKLGAPAEGSVRYLRKLPAAALVRADAGIRGFNTDGWVFPSPPAQAYAEGKELPVPLIVGSNAIEFPFAGTPEQLRKSLEGTFKDLTPKALALYGLAEDRVGAAADPLYGDALDQWGSDQFRCPGIVLGGWHSSAGNDTWEYQFDRAIPPKARTGHSSDLPYVFGNLYPTGSLAGEFTDADRRLSSTIQAYWTNFAKTGNPNGPGVVQWPKYDGKARKYLNFTTEADVVILANQRGAFCDLFREAFSGRAGGR